MATKSSDEDIRKTIDCLFESEMLAVLSTHHHGHPYASLVAFAATDDLKHLVFLTPSTTRKFANLTADPRVALLINNSRNMQSDLYSAVAVTALGKAQPIDGEAGVGFLNLFLSKHPHMKDFARAATTASVRVDIDRYIMVRNFQNVFEYTVRS